MDNRTSPGSNTPPRARDEITAAEQARMVAALQRSLQDGLRLQQATAVVEAIETHI